MEIIKNNSSITFSNTPWNKKSLAINSNEISKINFENNSDLDYLMEEFERKSIEENIALTVFRSSDLDLVKILQNKGFIKTEISLDVFISLKNREKYQTKNKVQISQNNVPDYIREIKNFAFEEFHFGRFLEDFKIEDYKARKRSELWIDDLNSNDDVKCLLGISKGNFIGFMYYKLVNNKIELILGGVKGNYAHLSLEFWKEVINQLFIYDSVTTLISAANPLIINLYSDLGFRFRNSLIGLHKHRDNEFNSM